MVKLVFTDQYANLFLFFNGLAIILYYTARKKNKQRAMKFGNYKTLQKIAGRNFIKSSDLVLLVRLLALTALLIGISNPVLVKEAPTAKSDYVIAFDSSSSMLASDLEPNRFEAAKTISSDFVSKLSDESKVGFVAFSGKIDKKVDLTKEHGTVKSEIENLQSGTTAGTAIGDAISVSSSMIVNSNKSRSIILITDGRNNVGSSVNESLEFAVNHNITIHAIGIGSRRNDTSNFGSINGANASKAEFPNLDRGQLRRVGNKTGGSFETATNNTALKSALVSIEQTERRQELTSIFVVMAAGFLIVEWIIGTTSLSTLP